MNTQQTPTDQNSMANKVPHQQGVSNNSRLFLVVAMSVLLTAVLAGSAVYFWQKSVNEKAINDLRQEITTLRNQTPRDGTVETSPSTTSSPELSPVQKIDPTKNWKTYSGGIISFAYPPSFYLDTITGGQYPTIYSANPRENKDVYYLSLDVSMNNTFANYINKQSEFNQISYDSKEIGSYSGYKVAGEPVPGGVSEEIYYIEINGNLVRLAIGNIPLNKNSNPEFQEFRSTVDKIFSTLQFTN